MSNAGIVVCDGLESGELGGFLVASSGYRFNTDYSTAGLAVIQTPDAGEPAFPSGVTSVLKIDAAAAAIGGPYGVMAPMPPHAGAGDDLRRGTDVFAWRMTWEPNATVNVNANVVLWELRWMGTVRRRLLFDFTDGTSPNKFHYQFQDASSNGTVSSDYAYSAYYEICWLHRASSGEDWLWEYSGGAWNLVLYETALSKWDAFTPLADQNGVGIEYSVGSTTKSQPTSGGKFYVCRIAVQEMAKSAYSDRIVGAVTNRYLTANGIGAHDDFGGTAGGADVDETPPDNITTIDTQTVTPINNTSITHVGTLATCTTSSAHGLATGDSSSVRGAVPNGYNGVYVVTVTGASTYTYTMASDPGADASTPGTSAPAGQMEAYDTVAATAGDDPLYVQPHLRFNATHTDASSSYLGLKGGIRSNGGTDLFGELNPSNLEENSGGTTKWTGLYMWDGPDGFLDPDGNAWTESLVNGTQVIARLNYVTGTVAETVNLTQAGLVYCVERIAGPAYPRPSLVPPRRSTAALVAR